MVTLTFEELRALMVKAWEHGRQWEEDEAEKHYRHMGGWVHQPTDAQLDEWKAEAREELFNSLKLF